MSLELLRAAATPVLSVVLGWSMMWGGTCGVVSAAAPDAAEPGADAAVGQGQVISFSGLLSEPTDGKDSILRRFDVVLIQSEQREFFCVRDDARAGCPWPESYGTFHRQDDPTALQPHLLYPFQEHAWAINLPPLAVSLPDGTDVGTSWDQGGWTMTVLEQRLIDECACWVVEARERRGRRQNLLFDAASGVLHSARSEVFMGKGEKFHLDLKRTATNVLNAEVAAPVSELQDDLLALQKALGRRPDSELRELTPRQVAAAVSFPERLHRKSEGTPLQELVMRLTLDLDRQKKRLAATASRAEEIIDTAAPEFALNLVSGGSLESAELRGKFVVLHFWDYRDQPLAEPYGQTGYLDFLYNQRRKQNVQVLGISTSPDFQNNDALGRARRSVRKLVEFMNLTYPIAWDDGSLLRALGDPRDNAGQLPLWVVLSPDGKVAHYHAGYYEIDLARGLKDLDDLLIQQIRSSTGE